MGRGWDRKGTGRGFLDRVLKISNILVCLLLTGKLRVKQRLKRKGKLKEGTNCNWNDLGLCSVLYETECKVAPVTEQFITDKLTEFSF